MKMVVQREKRELRHKLLQRLLSLTQKELKRRSANVEERLLSLPIYKQAKTVTGYYPLKGEVDILGVIRKAIGNNKRVCFPVMDLKTKELRAFEVSNLDKDFVLGPWGVKEPDTNRVREVDIKKIDMVIVPGLAFDRKKNRLGRGAGFYDRFLKKLSPSVKKAGVGFEFQILESLPIHLPSDQKVDIVVSENSVI
ncbi:MAG: 5-formyltetrahydrofolate cyclo-ligase [Candidatus Omnitrophota bacterium]